jgi:mRNA-degrading endonuclease RelE of RelBE toxin-antitoxin system
MKYLLDTCVISDFVKGQQNVLQRIKSEAPKDLAISSVVFMEIQYGLKLNPERARKITAIINTILDMIGDKSIQNRLLKSTRGLSSYPDCQNIKPLTQYQYGYRLRVGNWRVMFDVFDSLSIVSIEEVKKRDERTY